MRAALLVLVLAACADNDKVPPPVDAPTVPVERCTSPLGTAKITAARGALLPMYGRLFAGGIFTGIGDSGGPPGFDLKAYFTNEELTTAQGVIACEGSASCDGFLVDAVFLRGEEIGTHTAQVRDSGSTWAATGTVTLTKLVYPDAVVGRVAGSIHVESTNPAVAIDGTFDHEFCPGLVAGVL